MSEAGRILVVGDSAVAKHQLLAAIGASPASEQSGTGTAAADALLQLDTKYYTADADVELRHIDECASLHLGDGAYEAVLLVFDASRQPSFEAVQAWFEGAGGAAADLPIRLAVATGLHRLPRRPDGHADKPLWLAEAEEWCAEQLMEFVEVGEEAAGEAEAAAEAARGGEGATGAARVREALEAHMWPGMRLKAAPRHRAAAIAAAAAAEADEAEAAAAAALRQRQQQDRQQGQGAAQANGAAAIPEANGAPADGQAAAAAADEEDFSFSRYLQAPGTAAGGPGSGAAGAGAGAAAAGGEEAEVEQLERLFAQVAGALAGSPRSVPGMAQLSSAGCRHAAAIQTCPHMSCHNLAAHACCR